MMSDKINASGNINIGGSINQVYGGVNTGNIINISGSGYDSEQNHTLAEAVAEIQRLLKQLEETNPVATPHEQAAYINIAVRPELKQRVIVALKQGGEAAMEQLLLENKYLKVVKAIVQGWLQLGG
jgi:hypothetical protein